MIVKKYPSAATPIKSQAIINGILALFANKGRHVRQMEDRLKEMLDVKHVFCYATGAAGFYVILEALKKLQPGKNTVLLPAYAAPILKLPINKAGLGVKLIDTSLENGGMNPVLLDQVNCSDVLCIVPIHLLGVPMDISRINEWAKSKGIFVVEDAAQSFGARIDGKMVGGFADVGLLSFQRGKNLSTFTGGAIATNRDDIAEIILKITPEFMPVNNSLRSRFMAVFKLFAISKIVNPYIYRIIDPFISGSKSREVHHEFDMGYYSDVQAAAGLEILSYADYICARRHSYGEIYRSELSGIEGVIVPKPLKNSLPVYCQFPLIVKDKNKIPELEKKIGTIGVETTRRYINPLHKIPDMDIQWNGQDPYPIASYYAERLLCLPTHPLMNENMILKVVKVIKETV